MKPHYSLAEAFQRGLQLVEYPSESTPVSYYIRIYPEYDMEELHRRAAIEPDMLSESEELGVPTFNGRDPRVKQEFYGWTASMDYCNEDKHEIIHRAELTRSTERELQTAMHDYADVIPDARQRRVYKAMLRTHNI
jgi:hypothetical protein